MDEFCAPWIRPAGHCPGRLAEVMFVVFAPHPLPDEVALVPSCFGIPYPEAIEAIQLQEHRRERDSGWFDQWRTGPARNVAEAHIREKVKALDEAEVIYTVAGAIDDPEDLGHLQGAWALCRWLVERGATAVLDVVTGRFHTSEAVAAVDPDASLDIATEVMVVMEPEANAPDGEHYFYTAGLRKAARPDLVCAGTPKDIGAIAGLLLNLARYMYEGAMPAAPLHTIGLETGVGLQLHSSGEAKRQAERLGIENEVLLVTDEEGDSLAGLAAWLRQQALH